MEEVKRAFVKVKEDIDYLNLEIENIKKQLSQINNILPSIYNSIVEVNSNFKEQIEKTEQTNVKIKEIEEKITKIQQIKTPIQETIIQPIYKIKSDRYSDNPTDNLTFKDFKRQINETSIGSDGVPTDRQTVRQTGKYIENTLKNEQKQEYKRKPDISEIFVNIETLKEDIKKTIGSLTKQELIILSTIYQLEEENLSSDYKTIAKKLKLTEGTIRDHIQRLFTKKAPLIKEKIDNKRILLHIQPEFKKMLSLQNLINFKNL